MDKEKIFEKLERLIRAYGPSQLADKSGISRQGIYRLLTEKNPRFETLDKITSTLRIGLDLTRNLPSSELIYSSFRSLGAPISAKSANHPLPIEDCLAHGIAISRTDGFIGSMIPYLLYKKVDELDLPRLIGLCDGLGESRTLGYYADMASAIKPNEKLSQLSQVLFTSKFEWELLFKNIKPAGSFKRLAMKTNNPAAKRWKFLTIDSLEHHLERYRKWMNQK